MQTESENRTMMWVVVAVVLVIVVVGAILLTRPSTTTGNTSTTNTSSSSGTTTDTEDDNAETKTFALSAQNNSGQDGTAVLEEVGDQVRVTLTLSNPNSTAEPAHIHVGSCPNPGAIEFPLTNVVNGSSVTLIDSSFAALAGMEPLAINVHKSAAEASVYYACGDLDF